MCVGPSGRCVAFGICRWKSWLQIELTQVCGDWWFPFPPTTIDTFLLQYLSWLGHFLPKGFEETSKLTLSPPLMCSSIFSVIQVEFVEIRLRLNMICGLIQAAVKVPVRFLINCSPARSQVAMDPPPKHWKLMDQCPQKMKQQKEGLRGLSRWSWICWSTHGRDLKHLESSRWKSRIPNAKDNETSCCLAPGLIAAFLKSSTNNFSFCHANLIPQSTNPQIPIKIKSYPKKAFTSGCVKLINIFMTLSPLEDINSNCPTFSSYPPTAPTASSKAL